MDLLNHLTQSLGVTQDQARGGAGLIMRMAKEKLGASEFSQIANTVPNVDSLIKSAPEIAGTEKALGSLSRAVGGGDTQTLASLTTGFSKLGLDAGMVKKFVPVVLSFVQSKGGDNSRSILEKLLL